MCFGFISRECDEYIVCLYLWLIVINWDVVHKCCWYLKYDMGSNMPINSYSSKGRFNSYHLATLIIIVVDSFDLVAKGYILGILSP